MVRGTVGPQLGPVTLDILWSVVVSAGTRPEAVAQDLFLLWPGSVRGTGGLGESDKALSAYVESRGFSVIDEGRLPLMTQGLREMSSEKPAEPLAGGAPYVTYVSTGGPLGLSAPAT